MQNLWASAHTKRVSAQGGRALFTDITSVASYRTSIFSYENGSLRNQMVSQSQPLELPRSFKMIEQEAIAHALEGRWEEAIEVNLTGIEFDDANVGCHNRLAKAYLELSKYRDARASLKAALAIDPNNRVATRQMARLPIRQLSSW